MTGMVENRSFEMSVGMLSPSSAAELTRAIQCSGSPATRSIRCSEYPRRPNRRPPGRADPSLRPRTKVGQGKFKAWRRRLSRLDAGRALSSGRSGGEFSGLADGSKSQRGGTGYLRCSPGAEERHRRGVCRDGLAMRRTHLMAPAHRSAQACPPELVEAPAWPPWRAPSTSNCLPFHHRRHTVRWIRARGEPALVDSTRTAIVRLKMGSQCNSQANDRPRLRPPGHWPQGLAPDRRRR